MALSQVNYEMRARKAVRAFWHRLENKPSSCAGNHIRRLVASTADQRRREASRGSPAGRGGLRRRQGASTTYHIMEGRKENLPLYTKDL